MKLTRFGFNFMVLCWAAPLCIIAIGGNTMATGSDSRRFLFEAVVYAVIAVYAFIQLVSGGKTMSRAAATAAKADPNDAVVSFENINALEYIYCAVIVIIAAFTCWQMFAINDTNSATISAGSGALSIIALFWMILSGAVCLFSALQFWHLKSGAIVEVSHRVVQH
jgi:hypothetical protein